MTVPSRRIHALNTQPERPDREWVLYWMVASRRTTSNPGLAHAVAIANRHQKPLVVFEALRAGYLHASHRHHQFIMQGMADNARACAAAGVTYVPYVEPRPGAGRGLLEALAKRAVAVVTDLWPGFFIPRMQAAVAPRLDTQFEAVDGVGLMPLKATERAYTTAASFRRALQKELPKGIDWHEPRPLSHYRQGRAEIFDLTAPWPSAQTLAEIPIDATVAPTGTGGSKAANEVLATFIQERLPRYADDRKHPDRDASSGLSAYLHYGHIGATEVVQAVLEQDGWSPDQMATKPTGSRGWWGATEGLEAFLDEIVTWRELGHVFAHHREDYARFESIPDWAKRSLNEHRVDPRTPVSLEALEACESPDPLWNAAQRQLVEDGHIHNSVRMLWGKLVLAWTEEPEEAFERLLYLNDKYALDGRDPNSASGVAWVFGRHDRAWGPQRPIYGKVRYMTSRSMRTKLKMKGWLARYERP